MKEGLEKQHEGDLDALSEEAVRVTNRLKSRLTSLEVQSGQWEAKYVLLSATRVEECHESDRVRLLVAELESALKRQEETSRDLLAHSKIEAIKLAAETALRSESFRAKLQTDCDALRASAKQAEKRFETLTQEREIDFNKKENKLESEVQGLQKESASMNLIIEKLKEDLKESKESYRALGECSVNRKESSLVMSELTQSLQRAIAEKNILSADIQKMAAEKVLYLQEQL